MKKNLKYLLWGLGIFILIGLLVAFMYSQICLIKPINNASEFLNYASKEKTTCYDLREDCSRGRISYFSCVYNESNEEIISNLKVLYNSHHCIILMDSDGKKSSELAQALKEAGFKNIIYYENGYKSFLDSYKEEYKQDYQEEKGECDC